MSKKPRTEPQQRLYVVGDIHGRLDLLTRLLSMIEADALAFPERNKKLVFLGDYIDRGLDSKGVVERLLNSFATGLEPVFLRGNHDDRFLALLKGDLSVVPPWLQLGGTATISSYGISGFGPGDGHKAEKIKKELAKKMPATHHAFFEETLLSVTFGDYFFVHAGLRPNIPLEKQTAEDKMWIRADFITSDHVFEKIIVHGHTINSEPEIRKNRIGLDTGAFATGRLTCLVLDGTKQSFLTT
ncbi:MAG TPA: serine/threonine protein phosphatase [Rhodospirillaceae bacterium]|nr:serine/threonine protein phosphatase [Rhodospirillaceae bacterium]